MHWETHVHVFVASCSMQHAGLVCGFMQHAAMGLILLNSLPDLRGDQAPGHGDVRSGEAGVQPEGQEAVRHQVVQEEQDGAAWELFQARWLRRQQVGCTRQDGAAWELLQAKWFRRQQAGCTRQDGAAWELLQAWWLRRQQVGCTGQDHPTQGHGVSTVALHCVHGDATIMTPPLSFPPRPLCRYGMQHCMHSDPTLVYSPHLLQVWLLPVAPEHPQRGGWQRAPPAASAEPFRAYTLRPGSHEYYCHRHHHHLDERSAQHAGDAHRPSVARGAVR